MIAKSNLDALEKALIESERVAVVSHRNPDGDNLGSLLAMGKSMEKMGKEVLFVKADIIPRDYTFLPGVDRLQTYDESMEKIDLLVVLDSSDIDRLGENQFMLDKAGVVVNIDHHVSNTVFGDINIIHPEISSTGEILYQILDSLQMPIDKEIASLIYAAISTDTGRFTYQGVTGDTHRIISRLYGYDIDAYSINTNLYQTRSILRTRLFIRAISEISFFNQDKIGVVKVTQDMLRDTGASMEDTEGIVEFIRDTDSVEAACLLKEIESEVIKISLRTKENVDANLVCSVFDGGGHKRASGATINDNMENSEKKLIEEISKYI